MAIERSAAQLANDERLRQQALDKARRNAEERAAGASPGVFAAQNMIGPDDAEDQVTQESSISTDGEASSLTSMIDVVHPEQMQALAEDEKFMNELVEIQIEPSDNPDSPLFVLAGHNGVSQWIKVGETKKIKRKFLYSLLCAKSAQLRSEFGKNSDGKEFNRLGGPLHSTHRVIVMEDTAKGRAKYREWSQMA